ncbi:MAG: acyl-CoA dehydratase activase [Clostridiales Family XIII bacterium]|nr:acyl-CoA dehydratase activase [Clostridiales Family XIII bacterium]
MITAGVDVGLMNTKIVILRDKEVAAQRTKQSGGGGRGETVKEIWQDALKDAGIKPKDISKVVATGTGKKDVSFADKTVVEAVAAARAARFLYPESTSVVDAGADMTHVVTLGEGNTIREVVMNQKCMNGLGLVIEVMADRLGLTLDEISALAPAQGKTNPVNDGCPVFAELDALGLLNIGVDRREVAGAVTDAVVVRLSSILNDKIRPQKDTTVFIGGLAKNLAVTERLKERSGIHFLIPENAEYGGALGAAVIATDM